MAWYRPLALDPDAERLWAQELERLEGRYSGASDEEAGVLGHARGRILRFAGVLALLCDPGATAVTLVDMRRALVHMRYHLAHHQRFQRQTEVAGDRMDRLREQVERIHQRQPEIGVRPSDLRNNVDKSHYGGATGIQRALANLHALGWNLRRPKTPKGRSGRRAVPAFFPPGPGKPSAKSAKPPVRVDIADLADKIPGRTPDAQGVTDAGELIETASQRLLAAGSVALPRPGLRVPCPACGSPDGLGVLPEAPSRWHCHSDRHAGPRGGGAVDYFLAQRLERMPSVPEAVEEAKQILGLWDPPLQQEQEVAGPGGALSAAPQEGPHADWSEDAREEYEERAAIVEFEGGLSRQEAQILAEVSVRERWRQGGGRG
jgi:hypothetical protein